MMLGAKARMKWGNLCLSHPEHERKNTKKWKLNCTVENKKLNMECTKWCQFWNTKLNMQQSISSNYFIWFENNWRCLNKKLQKFDKKATGSPGVLPTDWVWTSKEAVRSDTTVARFLYRDGTTTKLVAPTHCSALCQDQGIIWLVRHGSSSDSI